MKKTFILIILSIFLSSCLPLVFTATTTAGVMASQDRSTGTIIDDNTLWAKITNSYLKEDFKELYSRVKITVTEGRVLLTGTLADETMTLKAVELAWKEEGTKEVINEISLEDSNYKISDYLQDTWISGQVKSKVLLTGGIKFVNYTIVTVRGVVYIFGIAKDEPELEKIASIAAQINGVVKVVCHAKVKEV